MPSPFPGMDPYLEGQLWPDVHHALTSEIRRQIVSQLPSRYIADLSIDYSQESPPPPLHAEDQDWLRALIDSAQEVTP